VVASICRAGDDLEAKTKLLEIIRSARFHGVDIGSLKSGGSLLQLGGGLNGLFLKITEPFIANPDLVERFKANLPLTPSIRELHYAGGAKGYIDYEIATTSSSSQRR
jgi:hypothetical protein